MWLVVIIDQGKIIASNRSSHFVVENFCLQEAYGIDPSLSRLPTSSNKPSLQYQQLKQLLQQLYCMQMSMRPSVHTQDFLILDPSFGGPCRSNLNTAVNSAKLEDNSSNCFVWPITCFSHSI